MSKKPGNQDPLRTAAEAQFSHAPKPRPRPPEILLHELQIYQIELEMQNEQLRQAQLELEKSRDRYVDFYDFAPVGYLTLSHEAMIDEVNLTGAALLGVERNKLPHHRFTPFVAREDRDRWHRHFMSVLKNDNKLSCELALQRGDGSRFYAQLDCLRLKKDGKELVVRIVLSDITERKQAETELRIAATAFESQDGIIVTNARNVILCVNRAFTRITGYTAEEAVGQTPHLLSSGRHDAAFYAAMWESILRTGAWQGEIWNRRKNGDVFPEQLTITAVKGNAGEATHYVGMMHDITVRRQAEEQIRALAFYDTLTQLPNRRLLNDRLVQAMATSKRSGRYGALMFLDMDKFKPLNDTYGHDVGDLLLVEVAQRLTSCVREMDTVARFGGDEFLVMLGELDMDKAESATQAGIVAEKIRAALAKSYTLKLEHEVKTETTVEYRCTSSIGVALFINHAARTEEIIKWADMAMYQAKEAGGNLIRFHESAGA